MTEHTQGLIQFIIGILIMIVGAVGGIAGIIWTVKNLFK